MNKPLISQNRLKILVKCNYIINNNKKYSRTYRKLSKRKRIELLNTKKESIRYFGEGSIIKINENKTREENKKIKRYVEFLEVLTEGIVKKEIDNYDNMSEKIKGITKGVICNRINNTIKRTQMPAFQQRLLLKKVKYFFKLSFEKSIDATAFLGILNIESANEQYWREIEEIMNSEIRKGMEEIKKRVIKVNL